MKTVLISLLLLIATNTQAEVADVVASPGGAPTFAHLQVEQITRNITTINPRFNRVTSAHVVFNLKNLTLTLNRAMPLCGPEMMCIQVMPAPLEVKLAVVSVKKTACSVIYTAVTPPNVMSRLHEEVVIEDLTNSDCPTAMVLPQTSGYVTYKVTGISNLTKEQETATARFSVDDQGFVRAVN